MGKLINCKECNHQVSKTAKACPSCGAKMSSQRTSTFTWIIAIIFGIMVFSAVYEGRQSPSGDSNRATHQAQADTEKDCAPGDQSCNGEKFVSDADVYCASSIERLAKYDHEWTDGWLSMKFSKFVWADKENRVMRYFGDKIKFQNGFGAWQPYSYYCDYDLDSKQVVDVGAEPGRL